MESLPANWAAFCAFALVIGARHGLDADHLATIDSLTRCNGIGRPRLARITGLCFSLGHGVVVLFVAIVAAAATSRWRTPEWLDVAGSLASIAILLSLGWVNMRVLLGTTSRTSAIAAGLRYRVLRRFVTVRSPAAVAAIGALFALSFDTFSLAALFAFAAEQFGGLAHTIVGTLLFVLGMACVDGVNGIWISRLVQKADALDHVPSRIVSFGVVTTSIAVALFAAARLVSPIVDQWSKGRDWMIGVGVTAIVVLTFTVGVHVTRRRNGANPGDASTLEA